MIEIAEKKIGHTTSWCSACINQCGVPDSMVCKQCRGHISTYHVCPDCDFIDHFYGHDIPDICKCGYVWPDLNLLKTEIEGRIEFHLGL